MGLVTVTDHDSIETVEPLRSRPDFFLNEEVSCATEHGTHIHIDVYGIEEGDHSALQTSPGRLASAGGLFESTEAAV